MTISEAVQGGKPNADKPDLCIRQPLAKLIGRIQYCISDGELLRLNVNRCYSAVLGRFNLWTDHARIDFLTTTSGFLGGVFECDLFHGACSNFFDEQSALKV